MSGETGENRDNYAGKAGGKKMGVDPQINSGLGSHCT